MTNPSTSDIIAGLDRAADAPLAALAGALNTDAPAGARTAHGNFQSALNAIRATADQGARSVAALREQAAQEYNDGLTLASTSTTERADAILAGLKGTLKDLAANAQTTLSVVEAEARMSLVPAVSTDSTARALARSEIESSVAGLTGASLVHELGQLVGQSPELDSEIMSDWGRRLQVRNVTSRHEAEELTRAFTVLAIAKLAAVSPPRSAMTAAAVKVLEAIPQAKGAVAAVHSSAALTAGIR